MKPPAKLYANTFRSHSATLFQVLIEIVSKRQSRNFQPRPVVKHSFGRAIILQGRISRVANRVFRFSSQLLNVTLLRNKLGEQRRA